MSERRVAYRYALALVESAENTAELDSFRVDLLKLDETLRKSHDLRVFFLSPVVNKAKKKTVVQSLFDGKLSGKMLKFLLFLCDKKREGTLPYLISEFKTLYDSQMGIVRASVASAVELSEDQKKVLAEGLTARTKKQVIPEYTVNPAIRAGFIVQIGDTIIDGSVRHQLEMLTKNLNANVN